jgi:hypothetical protein
LPESVVDLVRTGVIEILSLEPNLSSAEQTTEPLGMVQRRRPSDEAMEQLVKVGLEVRILASLLVLLDELLQCPRKGLGNVAATEFPETPRGIRDLHRSRCCRIARWALGIDDLRSG